jgi:hypothetical protein
VRSHESLITDKLLDFQTVLLRYNTIMKRLDMKSIKKNSTLSSVTEEGVLQKILLTELKLLYIKERLLS